MRSQDDKAYLLKAFEKHLTRRNVLSYLAAAGASTATLGRFAEALAAASSDDAASLTILCQPGLIPDIVKKYSIDPYNKQFPNVSITLDINSNALAYPKILAFRNNPVISGGMFNDIFAQKGIEDGMWEKFDPVNVPNSQYVPAELMTPGGYGIPFHVTPFGLMYNPQRVEKPTSWADLFNPKYKGRISMRDGYFDAYIAAAVMSGKGPSVEEGIKIWAEYKENIGYWAESVTAEADMVSRGEVWIAPQWGAWTEQARVQGKDVAFTIPKEGAVQWAGHMQSIVGFSPKVTELTQKFLDTWNSEECQIAWVKEGFFAPVNKNVSIPPEYANNEAILSSEESVKRLIRYDVAAVGKAIPELKKMVQRTLKS